MARVHHAAVTLVLGVCEPERRRTAETIARERGAEYVRIPTSKRNDPDETHDAILAAAARLETSGRNTAEAAIVLDCGSNTRVTDLIGLLSASDDSFGIEVRLGAIVTVVDATHVLRDLADDGYIAFDSDERSSDSGDAPTFVARALLAVTQIEYATAIVLANWQRIERNELERLMALLGHLSPAAAVKLAQSAGANTFAPMAQEAIGEAPGWVRILNAEFDPYLRHPDVSAMCYAHVRPFHPNRLLHLLDDEIESGAFGTVVRSAGLCRFATRPSVVARWDQVGGMISFEPMPLEADGELLAVGQEIAFIGLNLDQPALTAALDACVLGDAEFEAGPRLWSGFRDLLPWWDVFMNGH